MKAPLLIVGGGIGGLATALAAARAGRRVHVIEKSPEFTEIGAGLQLAPNATRMLDRVGVLDDVLKLATFPRNLVMMDAVTGLPLTRLDLGEAFRTHYGYPYILSLIHISEPTRLLSISYAVFCLKKKKK